jgi:hypothetical protein
MLQLLRRLNRDEYTATIRDLLDIHMDIGHALPVDGAGGEGFDNAAETLFLSPLHSEKYMEIAKFAVDFAAKEYKSRTKILVAKPGPGVSSDQAARTILKTFLPRAFRRPVGENEIVPYLALFQSAQKQGQPFESLIANENLINLLKEPELRANAIWALAELGTHAKSAIPTLVALLNDGDADFRSRATNALKQIDPEAAAKAGVK